MAMSSSFLEFTLEGLSPVSARGFDSSSDSDYTQASPLLGEYLLQLVVMFPVHLEES